MFGRGVSRYAPTYGGLELNDPFAEVVADHVGLDAPDANRPAGDERQRGGEERRLGTEAAGASATR